MIFSFGQDAKNNDIQVGGMIGTKNIGLLLVQLFLKFEIEENTRQCSGSKGMYRSKFVEDVIIPWVSCKPIVKRPKQYKNQEKA